MEIATLIAAVVGGVTGLVNTARRALSASGFRRLDAADIEWGGPARPAGGMGFAFHASGAGIGNAPPVNPRS